MLQTTTKKQKYKVQIDQQTEEAILQLQNQRYENKFTSDHDFLHHNVNALRNVLSFMVVKGSKSKDCKEIYSNNLKTCISLKRHQAVVFHFKVAKHFWRSKRQSVQDLLSSVDKVYEKYKKQGEKIAFPKLQLNEILIDYNIVVEIDKKFRFIEKIISIECQYFAKIGQTSQSFFNHYLTYCKGMDIITIFIYACQAYLKYIFQKGQEHIPKYNIFKIIYSIIEYFRDHEFIPSLLSYTVNVIIYLSQLLKIDKYRNSIKAFNQNGLNAIVFMEDLLNLAHKIDGNDTYKAIRTLIFVVMLSTEEQKMMKLLDPLETKLSQNTTILQSFRYLASLHNFIVKMKSNIKRSQIQAMHEAVIHNLKIILAIQNNEFLIVIQYIYYDMFKTKFSIYSTDIDKSNILDHLQNPHAKQIQKFIKWLGYFDLMLYIFEVVNSVKFKQVYKTHLQIKLYMLLAIHLRNNNKSSRSNLMHFLTQKYLGYVSKDYAPASSYYTVLSVLSKLCLSHEFGELANRCVSSIVKAIHVGNYCDQLFKYGSLFTNMIKQNCKDQSSQFYPRRNVFAADAVKVFTHDLIQSFGCFEKKDTIRYWVHYLRSSFDAFFYFYQDMDDESIDEILKEIVKISRNQKYFQQISSIIKETGLKIIHQSDFIKERRKLQLQNALIFYQSLYTEVGMQLMIKFKISFIDFCFNLKSDLYNLFNLLDSASIQHKRYIQSISDRIDQMEIVILHTTAPKYIEELTQLVIEGNLDNLLDVLSITIKSIFYIVYEEKFVVKLSQRKADANKTEMLYNFQQELEQCVCKLVEIKQKCLKMLPIFKQIYNGLEDKCKIGSILIKKTNMQWNKHMAAQLNDLMYMAHLCGVQQLKQMLLSMRLSLIYEHEGNYNVLLLQVSKYIFLNIFTKQEQESLTQFIKCSTELQQDEYCAIIKLLLFGQVCQQFQNRIFKIFYLLKLNGITFFNTFKDIISYFSYFLFLFPHLPSNLQRQKFLIKSARNAQIMSLNEKQYWIKDCWEEGWILTKLIIIVNKKILETAISTNQISKIRSFLKFSLLLCVRSAHISELQLPLKMAMNKQQPLNMLKVVDSLRKLQMQDINQDAYRQIDKMIFSKRYSISIPHEESSRKNQIARHYSKIQNSFKSCRKTGKLLSEVFCQLAAKQLNLNAFQSFFHRTHIAILYENMSEQDREFIGLAHEDRSLNEQIQLMQSLTNQIIRLIFTQYPKAVIVKDFISQFIDLSLMEENIQVLSANHHRMIDQIIAQIGLTFEAYNYKMKRLLQKIPKISIKEKDPLQIIKTSDAIMNQYNDCKNRFDQSIVEELNSLRHSNYPVSLIFPLGKHIYTISFHSKLLVTFSNRYDLEDKIQECQQLISINDKLIKQTSNLKLNTNKRLGLDRQLGKMCQSIDIGVLDIDFMFINKSVLSQFQKIDLNILKFAYNQTLQSERHFNLYAKRFRLHSASYLASARAKIKSKGGNQNLLLLIHQKYLQFPFELIKALRQNGRGIYRLPSIQYLLENQHRPTQYSIKKCKYLVNTRKDLPETQKRFEKIKNKFGQWMGIKGKIPQFIQIQMLLNQQLFLYMGHGTGLQHLNQQQICSLLPTCPMLVFGCSSAKMIFESSEPFGCAYNLLMKGCPAYMGCLWVVTDVDIDKVTQQIFLHSSSQNLSLILDSARKKCSFPHVNGSSTVVYGMPVHLKR